MSIAKHYLEGVAVAPEKTTLLVSAIINDNPHPHPRRRCSLGDRVSVERGY